MQLKRLSSSSPSMKLKTVFLNLITQSLYRLLRSLSRAKSILIEISKHNKKRLLFMMMLYSTKSSINQHNIFVGSSNVVPCTEPFPFSLHGQEDEDNHESRYLEWLEEKVDENNNINHDDHSVGERDVGNGDNDIDRLADIFIARCHEKFLLEKVESFRRFQEMLARSL